MQLLCAGFLGRENYVSMWAKKITGDMPTFVIGLSSISRGLDVTLVSVTAACTNIQPSTVSWPNPSSVHVHSVGIMRARVDVCIRCASSVYVCINCACVGHHACMCMCAYHRSRSRLQDATFPLHLGLRCPNPRPHHLRGYVCGVCVYCTCIFCA